MAITKKQKQAASNLGKIARFNASTTKRQLSQQDSYYDTADKQNRALTDVERKQNSRKAASERFGMAKKLQSSVGSILSAAGPAVQGSGLYGLADMIKTRTDLDNGESWNTLAQNQNAVQNAYNEQLNNNLLARTDASITAEQTARGIEADTAAQLNTINPSLFASPGHGKANLGTSKIYSKHKKAANIPKISGYVTPANAQAQADKLQAPATLQGGSYFDKLMNTYNKRKF